MEKLLDTLAKALVDNPEQVSVEAVNEDDTVRMTLSVAAEDMGKVIGKQGKIAKAIRAVVKAAAVKQDKKAIVDIKKNEN